MFPAATTRAVGLFFVVFGLLVLISATVTVAPVWLYGPSSPSDVSAGSQPDWYTGFLDGALRLVPPGWELVWLGHTWTLSVLVPLAVIGLFLALIVMYPFIEHWISADNADHNILDRPRNVPTRTAIGVAGITFYGVLWGAGSSDVVAAQFRLTLESVLIAFQCLLIAGPVVAFTITRRVCFALERKDSEILHLGYETGRIVRMPGGEYVEVHEELNDTEKWRLTRPEPVRPRLPMPDANGWIGPLSRLRASVSRFFFEDRLSLGSQAELLVSDPDEAVDGERSADGGR